ncbi:GNAT family N-acetyltransferase [Bacillus horti]|uniref:Ribosomal-protein-alanine N-acetyltransferase n=1 Tax=Caldalkalibacillus horti TaxID=77523 RepID=A0ABT9VTW8_9BACI|nr:GNAT family N-acetyltransferase [Bacillus horti]MDQ0164297.1 ribosomal-protein-alanine N-acetyltransferase [Bacillus horti]
MGAIEKIFANLPALETDRLLLRHMTRKDVHDMFEYTSDPEISLYTTWHAHQSINDTMRFIEHNLSLQEKQQVHEWAIVEKKSRKMIGTCGYVWWKPQHHIAEIAYAIARPLWGKGFMSEAVQAVLKFGFEQMELNRIEARCMLGNVGSERVMQKAGMTFEGILREQMYAKEQFHDLKLYAILKRDWLSPSTLYEDKEGLT